MISSKKRILMIISTLLVLIMTTIYISAGAATYKSGDMDKDGELTVSDVTYLQRIIAKYIEPDDYDSLAGDLNQDEDISISDVTILQRYVSGLISELPTFTYGTEAETQESTVSTDSEGWNNYIFQP